MQLRILLIGLLVVVSADLEHNLDKENGLMEHKETPEENSDFTQSNGSIGSFEARASDTSGPAPESFVPDPDSNDGNTDSNVTPTQNLATLSVSDVTDAVSENNEDFDSSLESFTEPIVAPTEPIAKAATEPLPEVTTELHIDQQTGVHTTETTQSSEITSSEYSTDLPNTSTFETTTMSNDDGENGSYGSTTGFVTNLVLVATTFISLILTKANILDY